MSAIAFLENVPKLKLFPKPEKEYLHDQSWCLNSQIITMLIQDLIPLVETLHEDKIIFKNPAYNYLKKRSDNNVKELVTLYGNLKRDYLGDYSTTVKLFQGLAKQLLSNYQRQSSVLLEELLYLIIVFEYLLIAIPNINARCSYDPNLKTMELLESELQLMKKIFNKVYIKFSNKPFVHGQYRKLFNEILKKDTIELNDLINNLI